MKKTIKIAILAAAVVAVAAGVLFVVIPLATSKEAEARLGEALAEAGIPEDMWSIDRAYYVPLFGYLVAEKLKFGERGSSDFLEAKKVTLTLDTGREDFFAGSVDAQGVSFSVDDTGVTVKSLSVNDFSVDKALFRYSPTEALKKLESIRLSDAVFRQRGRTYFSLGRLNIDADYDEGKIPRSSSVSLKELVMDVRQFAPLQAVRPEYRLSNFELKNSLSGSLYTIDLLIDGANLFTLKAALGISLPHGLLASGEITDLALTEYTRDIMMHSFAFTYTDKSLLDHAFELSEMPGDRQRAAEELNNTLMMFAMESGVDAKRFADEVTKFIVKPERFELKTNNDSPLSFEELSQNPFAMNLSFSINGGKPFTTSMR
jgi:hypothetical protein